MSGDPSLKVGKNLAIPQRWNRYTYSLNNPIKYADPDGRDIALSTDGNSCVTYGMMVQAAMRPTSRGALQSMAANTGATFTFADARINPPGQVQGIMAAAATGTMSVPDVDDASTRVTNTTTSAQTGATHYDIEIKLDTSAIQQVNTDPSGASTIGHESVHAQDLATGMDPEIAALNEPQAEARGEQVRRENADISPEQAKAAVDKMLEKK